jgi:hypothetical protein
MLYIILAVFIILLISLFVFKRVLQKFIVEKNLKASSSQVLTQNNDTKELTWKEKVDLSWQFLYSIIEIVTNKFSKDDRKKVQEIGKKLKSYNMKYDHIVELALQNNKIYAGKKQEESLKR